MSIGILTNAGGRLLSGEQLVKDAREAAAGGFSSYWLPSIKFGPDPLVSLALIGQQVPDIELGIGVRPIWPQHPYVLAQQALTLAQSIPDRLSLGVGASHPGIVPTWGYEFDHPTARTDEYLKLLEPALRNEPTSLEGQFISGTLPSMFPDLPRGARPRLYLAAMGPKMLNLAGRYTDGTVLWMTGPRTVRDYVRPALHEASSAGQRPTPRIIVGIPVLCTDDPTAGRALAAEKFGLQPSYRIMLDREGLSGPEDLAIIGDRDTIGHRLQELFDAGADEILCSEFGAEADVQRTRAAVSELIGDRRHVVRL
jgi:5,10-methylenetetrahydromethanopterin reductase